MGFPDSAFIPAPRGSIFASSPPKPCTNLSFFSLFLSSSYILLLPRNALSLPFLLVSLCYFEANIYVSFIPVVLLVSLRPIWYSSLSLNETAASHSECVRSNFSNFIPSTIFLSNWDGERSWLFHIRLFLFFPWMLSDWLFPPPPALLSFSLCPIRFESALLRAWSKLSFTSTSEVKGSREVGGEQNCVRTLPFTTREFSSDFHSYKSQYNSHRDRPFT